MRSAFAKPNLSQVKKKRINCFVMGGTQMKLQSNHLCVTSFAFGFLQHCHSRLHFINREFSYENCNRDKEVVMKLTLQPKIAKALFSKFVSCKK